MFDKPLGGTELMYNELMRRLPEHYKDRFSIFNYISQADFSKPTIYWNQLSYDQEAVQWLKNPENIDKIDQFVFVSHWQAEQYRKIFGIPGYKTHVIRNAHCGVERRASGKRDKVRICYTSTPWRGLDVLLDAWELIDSSNCELHIFSSCKIYGDEFAKESELLYQDLYDRCNQLPNVVYRGSIPNEELRKELPSFDILAYPCTFEETSCIAVIEALSAGLRVVTSSLGALPETTEGWANMYSYLVDGGRHAQHFASLLKEEIEHITKGKLDFILQNQVNTYSERWHWDVRIEQWINYLNILIERQSGLIVSNIWERQVFKECYIENEYNIQSFDSQDVVIDVGCHIGSFSKLAYDKGSRNIISFEANPKLYEKCKQGVPADVQVINKAVWRSDEPPQTLKFDDNIVDGNTGLGRVVDYGTIEVESVSLDSILEQYSSVKLLKIDAEGSEYPILFTSKRLNVVHTIVGEFHEFPTTKTINGYSLDRKGLEKYFVYLGWEIDIVEANWSNLCGFFKATNKLIT
jgi:FkbM family methyltransferase